MLVLAYAHLTLYRNPPDHVFSDDFRSSTADLVYCTFFLWRPHCAKLSATPARVALDCAVYVVCQKIVCGTFHRPAQITRAGEIPGIVTKL